MKIKTYIIIALLMLIIVIALNFTILNNRRIGSYSSLPSLPKPIAEEYVLITSAGQGTDAFIINDIANKLMIHNFFMPQAKDEDLEMVKSVVFVVDYSSIGEKLHDKTFEDEKKRIAELVNKAKEKDLVVITVYLGENGKRDKKAEELLNLIGAENDYIIGTKDADSDGYLSEFAKKSKIPLTLINSVSDLNEPFASVFR